MCVSLIKNCSKKEKQSLNFKQQISNVFEKKNLYQDIEKFDVCFHFDAHQIMETFINIETVSLLWYYMIIL